MIGGGPGADAVKLDPQAAADAEALREEFARHDAIMRALGDPGTLESAVAKAAFDRINIFVADLQLDHSVAEIAHQVRDNQSVLSDCRCPLLCQKPNRPPDRVSTRHQDQKSAMTC